MHNSHSYIVYPNISSSTKPFSSFSDKFFQIYAYKISIFSVLYRYKVRKLVFPDLAPLSTIGLFFFFYHNTLLTEPLLTQMTNRPLWTECTMMSQGLVSSKHLCKWCLVSRHTELMDSQQITLIV